MRRALVAVAALIAAGLPGHAHAAETLALRCNGNGGIPAMEASYMWLDPDASPPRRWDGPCWMHTGHNTYDLGAAYEIGSITGNLFSVEVQFSPPIELASPSAAALPLEASLDGRTWKTISNIPYPLDLGMRKSINFTADGEGTIARFLRIRQPQSAAQGLSGYLDHSQMDVEATPVAEAPPLVPIGARSFNCSQHIMERFFPAHPCVAGGLNRYDSPSVFHTYPLGGPARVTAVSGTVTFLPWRTDDYFGGSSRTAIAGVLQSSADGVNWTNLTTMSGTYGVPIDFATVADVEARYLRLVAEKHAQYLQHPALKHVRGMIADSSLTVVS